MTAQTILPANSVTASGYDVDNSLRFNDDSSDCLTDTMGTATNRKIFTHSFWIKRGLLSSGSHHILESHADANNRFVIFIHPGDDIRFLDIDGGSTVLDIRTNAKLRDPSAWYHIVCAVDTTQSTASNRTKIYINGVLQDSFSTNTVYSEDDTPDQGTSSHVHNIGRYGGDSGYFDGYMSEVVFIDGSQLTAASFGEFDSDSGIWRPIDVSGLTFGNNGFYLEFKQSGTATNASGMGADTSGNDHHFAVSNLTAVDQSTDTCTNNFATLAAGLYTSGATFSQGNLQYQAPGSNPVFGSLTTIGVDNGKWYAEVKYTAGSNHYLVLGIADEVFATLSNLGSNTNTDLGKVGASLSTQAFAQNSTVAYVVNTGKVRNNNANGDYGSGGGDGDIIQIALDRDNRKVYFGINGTYEASGDPGAGSNGFDLSSLVTGDTYFIGVTNDTGASETIAEFNFGSPSYAISSSNADANGHGNFEFAVPSGFFALCTKNLAEHG